MDNTKIRSNNVESKQKRNRGRKWTEDELEQNPFALKEWFGEKIDLSKTEKSNSAPQT